MTIHNYPAGERDDGRFSLLPYVLVTASVLLVLTLGVLGVRWLTRPIFRGSPMNQSRTDAQTVLSAATQYMIDNGTCPKTVEALADSYLSASTRLRDPWGVPFRLYCSNSGSMAGDVAACSDGPNQHHGDADDLCDPTLNEASLMMGFSSSPRVAPEHQSWASRQAIPELEKAPWKPDPPIRPAASHEEAPGVRQRRRIANLARARGRRRRLSRPPGRRGPWPTRAAP